MKTGDTSILSGGHEGLLVGGIDEAGRGSVLGPLVIAGLSIRDTRIPLLFELGVRDSKLLTPRARARLFGKLVSIAESVAVVKISPAEVDKSVFVRGLNRLEARAMAQVVNELGADEVFVDCCDTSTRRYKEYMTRYLVSKASLHSMHHADVLNVVVSAASIIAKITRDQEITEIRRQYRSIGSGYPSDGKTMLFIERWISRKGSPPHFARTSWRPVRLMVEGQKCSSALQRPIRGIRSRSMRGLCQTAPNQLSGLR